MNRRQLIRYVRARARHPEEILRVWNVESGLNPGAVGDRGTSFGPAQLHVGGALPRGRGRAWAESPQGVDYAIRLADRAAGSARGPEAVRRIVYGFERPADPQAEVQRALGTTPPAGGGGRLRGGGGGFARGGGIAYRARDVRQARASLQNVIRMALTGGSIDQSIATLATTMHQIAGMRPIRLPGGARANPGATSYGSMHGKIIGTPYTGTHTIGNWESDNAVDIAMPIGTPVYALFDGTIGSQFGSLGRGGRFAGLRLHLDGRRDHAYYAHLSKIAVRPGQRVRRGQLLGYSGEANGVAHLHLGTENRDPRAYLGR